MDFFSFLELRVAPKWPQKVIVEPVMAHAVQITSNEHNTRLIAVAVGLYGDHWTLLQVQIGTTKNCEGNKSTTKHNQHIFNTDTTQPNTENTMETSTPIYRN